MKRDNAWIIHHIGYDCNNNCKFCIVRDRLNKVQPSKEQLLQDMLLVDNCEKYYFTGGEPTLREDLPFLIENAKKRSSGVFLQTNARKFADKSYLNDIVHTGIAGAMVSFHAHEPKMAGFLLGSESYLEEIMEGLTNLSSRRLNLVTNTVVTRYNYDVFPDTIDFIFKNFANLDRVRVIYASFNTFNDKRHYIPLESAKDNLLKVLEKYGSRVEIENVPLCIVDSRKYGSNFNEFEKLAALSNGDINPNSNQRKYLPICSSCSARTDCCGLYKYYDAFFEPKLEAI